MADHDDAYKRRKEREREEDAREEEANALKKRNQGQSVQRFNDDGASISSERIVERMTRAETLMEQVNNLYNMYISGVERSPPNDRRKQLDELMLGLQMVAKPTQALQFRFDTAIAKYRSFKTRWDRLLRDLESGKIQRRIPNRG